MAGISDSGIIRLTSKAGKNKHVLSTTLLGLAVAVIGYFTARANSEAAQVKEERDPRDERIMRLEKAVDSQAEILNQLRERCARMEGRSAAWSERAKRTGEVDVKPNELHEYQRDVLKTEK